MTEFSCRFPNLGGFGNILQCLTGPLITHYEELDLKEYASPETRTTEALTDNNISSIILFINITFKTLVSTATQFNTEYT